MTYRLAVMLPSRANTPALSAGARSCCALHVPEREVHPLPIEVVRDLLGIARAA